MASPFASALGLSPTSSSSSTKYSGMYLCIHVDGYNQSLCSVDIDAEDGEVDMYAEESEPVELLIAIDVSESNKERDSIFQKISDGSIIRGLIELEDGYLESKNKEREAQGIDPEFYFSRINPCSVDLISLDKGSDWEGLYQKDSDLKYIGECDEYEFEENDKDVFTAGYTFEEVKKYAIIEVLDGNSLKVECYTSAKDVLFSLEKIGVYSAPDLIDEFKAKYSGKTFSIFGEFEWCKDEHSLKIAIEGLGLRCVEEREKPDIIFVGDVDTSVDGVYERWEVLISSCPLQHGKFSEPSLEEVFKASS